MRLLVQVVSFLLISLQNCSVLEMGKMVATAGVCFTLKLWKNYGCYCGFGSCRERRARDCLDSCCEEHDSCYGETGGRKYGLGEISTIETVLLGYTWDIQGTNIRCGDCRRGGERNKCRKCSCDRQFTYCLQGLPCPSLLHSRTLDSVCPPTQGNYTNYKGRHKHRPSGTGTYGGTYGGG